MSAFYASLDATLRGSKGGAKREPGGNCPPCRLVGQLFSDHGEGCTSVGLLALSWALEVSQTRHLGKSTVAIRTVYSGTLRMLQAGGGG